MKTSRLKILKSFSLPCRMSSLFVPFTLILVFALIGTGLLACGPSLRNVQIEDRIARLKRDTDKVRFAIRTTKTLVSRARGARYLPDLYQRLAELYVEQARYQYQIAYEKQKSKSSGVVSVQARLLKNQAIATYRRLLALYPNYPDAPKVLFFEAHEMRELGKYEKMLETYQELADKYTKSKYRLEGLLVMGDYWFDKNKLDLAEKYYNLVLATAETRVHAMARYKLAWCRINRADFKSALKLFEGSIRAARKFLPKTGGKTGGNKIDLRREALVDSVFSYTEVHKYKGSLRYFKTRADSKTTYLAALDKLGNRYYIKQNWKATALIYREILSLTGDVEDAVEYANRLFEAVTHGNLFSHGAEDVDALTRVLRRRYYNAGLTPKKRERLYQQFEKFVRFLATKLQDLANEKKDEAIFLRASAAYKTYLTFFSDDPHATSIQSNLAETLYSAKRYLEAAQYYELAAKGQTSKDRRNSVYTAIAAYFEALKLKGKSRLSRLNVVQARAGLRRAGKLFIRFFSRDPQIREVKFNIARTHYDAGNFDEAILLFTALVEQFPTSKEATVSAHLALDSYRNREDYDGVISARRRFQHMARLGDAAFKGEMVAIVKGAENALLRTETIKATSGGGEGTGTLEQIAAKYKGTALGEKA
ncbi:MAG: tetratricopeptide repeat protein, partial [Deltaproteobacteria bacterium]|nr:tetratricopeptide repeat protein [Deltaproteobacteria bacterium]